MSGHRLRARKSTGPARASLGKPEIEALLGTRPVAKTDHFVLYCLPRTEVLRWLSTEPAPSRNHSVDRSLQAAAFPAPIGLAAMVPKRHARRSVTRNLIKRAVRESMQALSPSPAVGNVLVRLRAPFDTRMYPSAASTALRAAVRAELDVLWARCALP